MDQEQIPRALRHARNDKTRELDAALKAGTTLNHSFGSLT